jgi:hypothetical protein
LLATASRRTGRAVLAVPMVDLPLETEPVVEGKALVDVAPMEGRELGGSGRTLGSEMRPGRAVGLPRLINLPDTRGQLPEWDGPSNRTLPSAED